MKKSKLEDRARRWSRQMFLDTYDEDNGSKLFAASKGYVAGYLAAQRDARKGKKKEGK